MLGAKKKGRQLPLDQRLAGFPETLGCLPWETEALGLSWWNPTGHVGVSNFKSFKRSPGTEARGEKAFRAKHQTDAEEYLKPETQMSCRKWLITRINSG